ncbi:MAG: hypothetical protein MUF15_23000 [Acidobacteria bacterium]|nr:hypothetical protein [Acidobacteriota bacterium]
MKLIKMKAGVNGSIFVEVPEEDCPSVAEMPMEELTLRGAKTIRSISQNIDQAFDDVIKNKIIENCKTILSALEEIKSLPLPPENCNVEFGLQFNGQGDIYIAKISAQANFKISFQWNLNKEG